MKLQQNPYFSPLVVGIELDTDRFTILILTFKAVASLAAIRHSVHENQISKSIKLRFCAEANEIICDAAPAKIWCLAK